MSDEGREELTRGEDFESVERRVLGLFDRMAARVEAEAEASRRRDGEQERRAEAMQRNIDFIVRQQAEFTADIRELRELQKQGEEKWSRTSDGINALLAVAEMHQREFFEVRRAQAEALARTDAKLAETGARVDALVNTVERLIIERRNGGRRQPEGSDE